MKTPAKPGSGKSGAKPKRHRIGGGALTKSAHDALPVHMLPPEAWNRSLSVPKESLMAMFLGMVRFVTEADAVIVHRFDEEGKREDGAHVDGDEKLMKIIEGPFGALADQTMEASKPIWRMIKTETLSRVGVSVPVLFDNEDGRQYRTLSIALTKSPPKMREHYAALLQAYSIWFPYAELRRARERDFGMFSRMAAFVELVGVCAKAPDYKGSMALLADHLRDVLGCQMVGMVVKKKTRHELVAISGGLDIEQKSEGSTAFEATISDASRRDETFVQEPSPTSMNGRTLDIVSAPVHQLAKTFNSIGWVASPLKREEEASLGGWVFLWNRIDPDFEEKLTFIKAAAPQVSQLLHLLKASKPDGFNASVRALWRRATGSQRQALGILGVILAVIALFPIKERIKATCEVKPVIHRVIAAPFDGVLRKSYVEAGDMVQKDALLAEMDGREIRFQLAEVIANKARATKQSDNALSVGKIAESQMAALEARGYEEDQKLLEERQENLEIRAAIDGMILRGDVERSEGAPLRMGDRLFEVVPTDRMLIELAVDESEISFVEEGMHVKFRLDSYPGETFEGQLRKIAPRSSARDSANVFLCETEIDNASGELRPGMKGNSKVHAKRRPLLWTLIRPAVNWVRLKLLW